MTGEAAVTCRTSVRCGVHTDAQSLSAQSYPLYRLWWIVHVLVFKRRLATPRGNGSTRLLPSTAFLEASLLLKHVEDSLATFPRTLEPGHALHVTFTALQ